MRLVHTGDVWKYVGFKMSQSQVFAQPVKECAITVTLQVINHVMQSMKSI